MHSAHYSKVSSVALVCTQVVPVVFMLRESLEKITEEDNGVKTWKALLLGSVTKRMAVYETKEHFAVATVLDPRYCIQQATLN